MGRACSMHKVEGIVFLWESQKARDTRQMHIRRRRIMLTYNSYNYVA
jgi:hypothetical protein